jgi:hypothetical protein
MTRRNARGIDHHVHAVQLVVGLASMLLANVVVQSQRKKCTIITISITTCTINRRLHRCTMLIYTVNML